MTLPAWSPSTCASPAKPSATGVRSSRHASAGAGPSGVRICLGCRPVDAGGEAATPTRPRCLRASAGACPAPAGRQSRAQSPPASLASDPTRRGGLVVAPAAVHDSCEVTRFLRHAGLQAYAIALVRQGFDSLEELHYIDDADLRDARVPPHLAARLRRKLQEVRKQAGAPAAERELDARHPLVEFLGEVGIAQYARALISSGFDDVDTLALADDQDLKDIGILRGHALKLRRRLAETEAQRQAAQATCVPPTAAAQPCAVAAAPCPARGFSLCEAELTAVGRSWRQVEALGVCSVGELLYTQVFKLAPVAINLFPEEVRSKYRDWTPNEGDEEDIWHSASLRRLFGKIVSAVGCTVAGLHDMGQLVPMLMKLGMRHIHYGVAPPHWQVLGNALDLTLRDILGADYTHEVQQAWHTVYGFMSSIMIEGFRHGAEELERCAAAGAGVVAEVAPLAKAAEAYPHNARYDQDESDVASTDDGVARDSAEVDASSE